MCLSLFSCSGNQKNDNIADKSYIKTHEYVNSSNTQSAGWRSMEELCSIDTAFLIKFVVSGEYSTYESVHFNEEGYNLEISDIQSKGIELDEKDKEELKENVYTSVSVSNLLPVEFGDMILSGDKTEPQFDSGTLRAYCEAAKIKEIFPVGAEFLLISWNSTLEPPLNVPPLKEYVFYIDSENKLTPVFDIPTTAEYAGYTVDEFIEAVKPWFEGK